MEITNINQLNSNLTYTYADYLLWKLKERVELFKGKVFKMSPAPSRLHQEISFKLTLNFGNHFANQKCKIYTAPFDVRFPDEQGIVKTVVQPDLCIICDEKKLDDKGAVGAPDLVVEILSTGNSKREMKLKYELYQSEGVKEYWVVRPYEENIQIFVLKDGRYYGLPAVFEGEEIQSQIFPSLRFSTKDLFKM